MNVAVLCAAKGSAYEEMTGVDVYDADRDCRTFKGGMPVVAHPPCRAWSATCRHQSKASSAERWLGPYCVDQVRRCGGVLEHPAHSRLWEKCGLPLPGQRQCEARCVAIQQHWFGHSTVKHTWLYMVGVDDIPPIPFRLLQPGSTKRWNKQSKKQRAATAPLLATWLVECARKAKAPYVPSSCH